MQTNTDTALGQGMALLRQAGGVIARVLRGVETNPAGKPIDSRKTQAGGSRTRRINVDYPDPSPSTLFAELRALQGRIAGITGFSGGADTSKEGLTKGFTHGFCMTFTDVAARDAYLPHSDHQRVVEQLLPLHEGGIEGVLTFDFSDAVL